MPGLIQDYRDKATAAKVKKFYSTLSQAYAMAVAENGTLDNWGIQDFSGLDDETKKQEKEKFLQFLLKYFNKSKYSIQNSEDKTIDYYILADGTLIRALWLSPTNCKETDINSYCGDIYFQVDEKVNPDLNTSYDPKVFSFVLYPNKIVPTGNNASEFSWWCLSQKRYSMCTAWVIKNENLDYLHCNDLQWNGKRKCK